MLGADTAELAHRGGRRLTWASPPNLDAQRRATLDAGARESDVDGASLV